jgi:hypothetical protein
MAGPVGAAARHRQPTNEAGLCPYGAYPGATSAQENRRLAGLFESRMRLSRGGHSRRRLCRLGRAPFLRGGRLTTCGARETD